MTTYKAEPTVRARLARAAGPEFLALILVGVLVVGGVAVAVGGSIGAATPSGGPSGSVAGAGAPAGVVGSPSASLAPVTAAPSSALATAPPTPTPSPSPSPSPTPISWAPTANVLLDAEQRVIEWREALRTELAGNPKRSDELARLIRSANSALQVAMIAIGDVGRAGAPADLVDRLSSVHQGALDAGLSTLTVTLQDVTAYRSGATKMVAALEPVEGLMREISIAAGVPDRVPEWSPPPGSSAAPSGSAVASSSALAIPSVSAAP